MKKVITGVAVLVMLAFTPTFANSIDNNESVNKRVERSFKKEFASAKLTSWSKVSNLFKAEFTMNGQVMFAYLNEEGEVVGIYRNILSDQLPIQLLTELKDDYSDYWITTLFEMVKDHGTSYFIALENGTHQLVLKSDNSSNWFVYSKIKK